MTVDGDSGEGFKEFASTSMLCMCHLFAVAILLGHKNGEHRPTKR